MTSYNHGLDLTPLHAGLEQPLQLVTDLDARERLQAYINAARPQVERAAFDLLSQAVDTINSACTEQRAQLQYAGGGLRIQVEDVQESVAEPAFEDGDVEKVTLRLPRELKEQIDAVAMRHGVSANNWYVRELSRVIARRYRESLTDTPGEASRGGRRRGAYRGRGERRRARYRGDSID